MNYLIARRGGLLVHGCGVVDRGKGYLFAGHADHGKSTIAKLWGNKAEVLGDEIVAVIAEDGGCRIYGTPWHGDYPHVSYGGLPLEKIFFLRHSEKNFVTAVTGATAGSYLLARSFSPLWDREATAFALGAADRLVNQVPCYELGFLPDDRVVEFVRDL